MREIVSPLGGFSSPLGRPRGINPASLFTVPGSRGFMFDLSDYATQWQDTAGTVPITSTAQSLARVNDLSGLGNHATQATAGSCPTTTTMGAGFRGVQFDGVDDWLQTAAIDFSNSDEVTVVAGVRKLSDAEGVIAELSPSVDVNNNSMGLFANAPGGPGIYQFRSRGTTLISINHTRAAPDTAVLSGLGDISAPSARLRRNGVQVVQSTGSQGTGNYSNAIVYIGRRGGSSLPFNGILTFLFVINRLLTANELAAVEAYANARTGAF